eukprot:GFYU01003543.1.p1 GENE.GFYU01003543.1~~GFYU01003543.1.p1  ORF type:complete len:546 (-),score=72.71 GFYU01003543.1:47-1684(-)
MVRLWPRLEVFYFAHLPPLPLSDDSIHAPNHDLSSSIQHGYEMQSLLGLRKLLCPTMDNSAVQPTARVSLSTWMKVVVNHLKVSQTTAQVYFNTCESLLPSSKLQVVDPNTESTVMLGHLLLMLFVQSFKAAPPKSPHKKVADIVWPSNDGQSSAPSPRQLALHAKGLEEVGVLPFLKQHLGDILQLLASPLGPQELTKPQFDVLGFLIAGGKDLSGEVAPLSALAPFWLRTSEARVPISEIEDWTTAYLTTNDLFSPWISSIANAKTQIDGRFPEDNVRKIDGRPLVLSAINKKTVLKTESDINGENIKIVNSHNCYLYILAPVGFATVFGCTNCTIVLGSVQNVLGIEHCERVKFVVATRSVRISSCMDISMYVCSNTKPMLVGDNRGIQFGPYNTFYPQLESHMRASKLTPKLNMWKSPVTDWDPDIKSHASNLLIQPENYNTFSVPFKMNGTTRANPCTIPPEYAVHVERKQKAFTVLRQAIKEIKMDDNTQKDLQQIIQNQFKEWLMTSGNLRQIQDLLHLDQQLSGNTAAPANPAQTTD